LLLGSVGLLTALLAALATANGGIARTELNERFWLVVGTLCVLGSLALGGFALILGGVLPGPSKQEPRSHESQGHGRGTLARWTGKFPLLAWKFAVPLLLLVGVLALVAGLGFAALAAVTHVSGRPNVTANLKWATNLGLLLDGEVSVSDIPSSQHLEMDVVVITHRKERVLASPIYEASFGPVSSGDVNHNFEVPLPRGASEVYIRAWSGGLSTDAHCFDLKAKKGPGYHLRGTVPTAATLAEDIKNNLGCLHLRIPASVGAHSAKAAAGRAKN